MCKEKSELTGRWACICRAHKGAAAYDCLQTIAPNLPADWEESVGWRAVSEQVTGKQVVCGKCEDWWTQATHEITALSSSPSAP